MSRRGGELQTSLDRLEDNKRAALEAKTDLGARLLAWHERWLDALRAADLPADLDAQEGDAASDSLRKLSQAVDRAMGAEDRREKMAENLAAFREDLQALLLRAAPDLALAPDDPHDGLAGRVQALKQRLQAARQEAAKHADLVKALAEEETALAAAEQERADNEARLRPLMELGGVSDREALREAIERSDRQRILKAEMARTTEELADLLPGQPAEALGRTLAARDPEDLESDKARLTAELEASVGRRDELVAAETQARSALAAISGDTGAAEAALARDMALAEMSAAAGGWLRAKIGARILRWAIERYRRERTAPMLADARRLFAALTLGAFRDLDVVQEGEGAALVALRAGGETIAVDALSDGTRDQLYLALRVAAILRYLESGAPVLPFIADDLFVSFDDERSAAGFQVLAELAEHTQVLFFTHHAHLMEIAERTLGRDGFARHILE